ncbi:MAG: N-acyl homoserine lactonase family protein [Thermodesulfobacteriota bacterium]|nr:MAG: N-acyl homoserine lactonase family protein [Thermodesulfobacteriota bacterium]
MTTYTIYPLVVGAKETDQGIMTYLKHYGKRIWIPIIVFYVKGGNYNILVDTGLEDFVVPDEVSKKYGVDILYFEDALAKVGVKPEDIDIIIHTHLHNDHCENDYKCPKAKIFVQKAEYEFLLNPHPVDHRYFADLLEGLDVNIIEGDQEIVEGIKVIFTPGHTPGGQSVMINTTKGKAIITGFCCNEENFPKVGPVIPSGVHINVIEAYESAKKVKEMADILIPNHAWSVAQKKQIP